MVLSFERSRFNGSEKFPACKLVILKLQIESSEGISIINHRIYFHSSRKRKIAEFFVGIGNIPKGEESSVNWNKIIGSTGRAKVGINKYTGNDGREYENNEIIKVYEPETPAYMPPAPEYVQGSF